MERQSSLPRSKVSATCSCTEPHLPSPYTSPISWRFLSISYSHLRLGLPIGLFPSCFLTKPQWEPLLSSIRETCPAYLTLPHSTIRITFGGDYRLRRSSSCSLLQYPLASFFLGPNIFLNIVLSNTLSLRCSLILKDQVRRPNRFSKINLLTCRKIS